MAANLSPFCDPGTLCQTLRLDPNPPGTGLATGTITGINSAILGGPIPGTHVNDADTSVILMGANNSIFNTAPPPPGTIYNLIGNGLDNVVNNSAFSSIINGDSNNVSGIHSTVVSGDVNQILGDHNIIASGVQNSISGVFATPGSLAASNSVIVGGSTNLIDTTNITTTEHAIIGGGELNIVQEGANHSGIFSGRNNQTQNCGAVVAGGENNRALGSCTFAGGGQNNCVAGNASGIASGINNVINGLADFIGSGENNIIDSNPGPRWSSISGGEQNIIGFVGGPSTTFADHSFIGGGLSNRLNNERSVIVGGENNVNCAIHSFLGGGNANNITEFSNDSVIGGGANNIINSLVGQPSAFSFIGGGQQGNVFGNHSSVVGGNLNVIGNFVVAAPSDFSVISGGNTNVINGGANNAVISGGANNTVNSIFGSSWAISTHFNKCDCVFEKFFDAEHSDMTFPGCHSSKMFTKRPPKTRNDATSSE